MWLKLVFVASFCTISVVSSPGGAPLTACEDMIPRHLANQPQTSPLPVTLEVPSTIISGQPITIRIVGTQKLPSFGGFQIQARTQNEELIGTFRKSEVVGVTNCRNISASSATHINMGQKASVNIIWEPPVVRELLVFNFHITIAANFQLFWAARRTSFNFVIPSDLTTTTEVPTFPTLSTKSTTTESPGLPTSSTDTTTTDFPTFPTTSLDSTTTESTTFSTTSPESPTTEKPKEEPTTPQPRDECNCNCNCNCNPVSYCPAKEIN